MVSTPVLTPGSVWSMFFFGKPKFDLSRAIALRYESDCSGYNKIYCSASSVGCDFLMPLVQHHPFCHSWQPSSSALATALKYS